MSYSTSNPPRMLVPGLGASSALWTYRSTNTTTEVLATGFFSNGSDLGMKAGDFVLVASSTGFTPALQAVSSVTASSAATVVGSTV